MEIKENRVIPPKPFVQKLQEALVLRYEEQQISEPHYYVLGSLSEKASIFQKRWRYASEINRILNELRISILLVDHIPPADVFDTIKLGPEDAILFYEGIFPELTHQLKDKILSLLELLLGLKSRSKDGTEKRIRKILKSAEASGIDLESELSVWRSEQEISTIRGIIAAVLNIRKDHHHFLSKIPLNEFYQDIKMSRAFSDISLHSLLSDYGKDQMRKRGSEGLINLRNQAKEKLQRSLGDIEKNIELLSKKIISNFDLDYSTDRIIEHIKKREALENALEIRNPTSLDKVNPESKSLLEDFLKKLESEPKGNITALYFVGSAARGDFDSLYSDINFYWIVKDHEVAAKLREVLPIDFELDNTVLTQDEFLDTDSLLAKKERFICKYDGILLRGDDLIGKEKFPKPGAELAWLLNHDFLQKLLPIEEWAKNNGAAPEEQIGWMSKRVLKIFFDAVYGVAISNDPRYIHNRKERIEFADNAFPQNKEIMMFFKRIFFSGGIANMDGLLALINKAKEVWQSIESQLKPIVDRLYKSI